MICQLRTEFMTNIEIIGFRVDTRNGNLPRKFRRFILQVNLLSIGWQRETFWAWVNSAVVLSGAVLFDFGHWIQGVYSCVRSKQSCPTLQTTGLLSYRKTFWIECNVFAASSFVSPYWLGMYVVAILCYLNTVNSILILSETFRRWTRQILCVNTVITFYKSYLFSFFSERVLQEKQRETYSKILCSSGSGVVTNDPISFH